MEATHPTLRDLYNRLLRFITTIPYRENNLEKDAQLSHPYIEAFINYLEVSQDRLAAAAINNIPIEPILGVADEFKKLNLLSQARTLENIYRFALGIRKWYRSSFSNPGTPIEIKLELNYDEVTPQEQAADNGYTTFARLFKSSCNYTTRQKRALYDALKELYTTIGPANADKTVMAVILIFRKPKTKYRQPFGTIAITKCKEIAMEAFGRDAKAIKSYTENSLDNQPQIGQAHRNRAESIIAKALESAG